MSLDNLQAKLGYQFIKPELLKQALTHRSYASTHNERLEFLGDSVLNCAIAALLFEKFAGIDEGDLSRVRANLVKQPTLHEIAVRLELSLFLLLGDGEQKSGGARRPSIMADAVEAIIGATFLDGGFDAARQLISRLYAATLARPDLNTLGKDAKTQLQEYLQSKKIPLPNYQIVATLGAAHSQEFEVQCDVPSLGILVTGKGASRRAAEQAAASIAMQQVTQYAVPNKPNRKARAAVMTPHKKSGDKTLPVIAEATLSPVGHATSLPASHTVVVPAPQEGQATSPPLPGKSS